MVLWDLQTSHFFTTYFLVHILFLFLKNIVTMASNIEVEIEMKTPAEKVWSNIREFVTVYPKALPHIFEKFDVLEGDGRAVGSILVTTFNPGKLKLDSNLT